MAFNPHQGLSELLQQSQRDIRSWLLARGEGETPKWEEWAGGHLPALMRLPDETLACLRSADASIRLAAIALVAEYWQPAERFADDTLRLAFEDPDARIRGAALSSLLHLWPFVGDPTGLLRHLLDELFSRPSIEEAAQMMRPVYKDRLEIRQMMKRLWEERAGPHAARMLESRATAEAYLTHPQANLRLAAIMVLKDHWKPDASFVATCEMMVLNDTDPEVRAVAVVTLAGCYKGTDDRRVGGVVARVVQETSAPLSLRRAAYRSLFQIRGMPYEAYANAASDSLRFPEDADWQFVNSFLTDSRHAGRA
jgi:hypothetical protein